MEVPFLSSSAISRAHYNLVQKVEVSLPQHIDDLLCQEVETLRKRVERHRPTPSETVELLVLLLYCATATLGRVTCAMLEFAVPHAVTLAEAGSTNAQKRIGYLFCNEVMNLNDEMQVMLVNTLRKDLEDPTIARICLALDMLLTGCPPDAAPAVTPRLIDLLAHDSPHVKRKAMAVIKRICLHDMETLQLAKDMIRLRLKDSDPGVSGAAMCLLPALAQNQIITTEEALEYALDYFTPENPVSSNAHKQFKLAKFLGYLADGLYSKDEPLISTRVVDTLHRMLTSAKDDEIALILEIFRTLSNFPTEVLTPYFSSKGTTMGSIFGRLIGSTSPNIQYFSLVSLLALDPLYWAGTTGLIPSAFVEDQVYTIMSFLESPDSIIRLKTLQVLYRVDPQILATHLSQLQSAFRSSSRQERARIAERILEVAAELDNDGETYALHVKEVSIGLDNKPSHNLKGKGKTIDSGASLVFENIVERVLFYLRTRSLEFHKDFTDATNRIPVSDAGPTLTLIIAAAVCEYGALSSIPQEDLLRGLSGRLNTSPPAIQEALLLAMLRVTARCSSLLPDVTDEVRALHGISRSHIRYRCDQYLYFSDDLASLKNVAMNAKSDTLPDFIYALEKAQRRPSISQQRRHKYPNPAPRPQASAGKLRYEAYEPPRAVPKLTRRPSSTTSVNSHTSSRSRRSDSIISYSHSQSKQEHMSTVSDDPDDLSRTLTAGDLALAAHGSRPIISSSSKGRPNEDIALSTAHSPPIEDLIMKTDLITLDSPFLADPHDVPDQGAPLESHSAWEGLKGSMTSRGWCEISPQKAKQRVQTLQNYHVATMPFDGQAAKEEFLLVISRPGTGPPTDSQAALRLLPGEDDSTLWQLRYLDSSIKSEVRRLLNDT